MNAKVLIWWGVALSVIGTLISFVAPRLMALFASQAFGYSQDAFVTAQVLLNALTNLAIPVGASLFAAGLVVVHINRTLGHSRAASSDE